LKSVVFNTALASQECSLFIEIDNLFKNNKTIASVLFSALQQKTWEDHLVRHRRFSSIGFLVFSTSFFNSINLK